MSFIKLSFWCLAATSEQILPSRHYFKTWCCKPGILLAGYLGIPKRFNRCQHWQKKQNKKTVSFSFTDHLRDSHQALEAGVALNYQKAKTFLFFFFFKVRYI